MNLIEFSLSDTLAQFPEITPLSSFLELANTSIDFYLVALGFEERTISIPENLAILAQENDFCCEEVIYFSYETSTSDNSFNEPRLNNAFNSFKNNSGGRTLVTNMPCDEDGFIERLQEKLNARVNLNNGMKVQIILDISVCSSKLILNIFKIFFKIQKVELKVLYTEASLYFPTYEEYISNTQSFLDESELSTTQGNEDVVNSNEYSEGAKENADLVVAFAPFKVGRINKIVSDIDESILINNANRLIWIIGEPNFEDPQDRFNRIRMIRNINKVADSEGYEVSTLDYKATIEKLDTIYQTHPTHHMNIADLGSKMQTVGISIFYHIRPDVSVYYALPKKYNSSRYSRGVKKHWSLNIGDFEEFLSLINKIDNFEIQFDNPEKREFYF